jgi:serine phosphatase RsbU (regulator of sigma subunit)/pSer/pThr/pTyr-binding forkhead associated (FHA) protein
VPAAAPRLLITDTQGLRIIPIDRPVLTIGRRTETDICVPGAGVSRLHAEIVAEAGLCRLRDRGSKFGTFVNGERRVEHTLAHGDQIRLGRSDDVEIVFVVGEEAPSSERSATAAASELRHMAGLLEGLRALGSGRVLEDVLALVLDSAISVAGAERGFIMLAVSDGRLEFKLARGRGRLTLSGRTFDTSRKIPEQVFATGQPTIVADLLDDGLAHLHTGTVALGIRTVLCTPLRLVRYLERADEPDGDRADERKIIGVLYLDSREKGALQSASTRSALDTLSIEAAVAIENARLYREAVERAKIEQELKIAAAIQQSLLPAAGRVGPFFTAAAASVPCRAVGGDFFDYVELPDGQFGFILGDVAGKGPPAALLAAALLGMFGAESLHTIRPAEMQARMNRGLLRRPVQARFLTSFYGTIDSSGCLTYSNGGHNPPVLLTAEGSRRLDTGGYALGFFEEAAYQEEAIQLSPGDVVVAFSDGVTEAFNEAGEEFTDERLVACLQAKRGQSPEAMLEGILAEVRAFSGNAMPSDDVTIVVVRYDGRR